MRLLKPAWVSHDGKPIFSIDIHPDGSRFVTGGQGDDSGKVAIWNIAPVKNEKVEKDENVPKLLCSMDNHLACVNSVRWSMNGKYLASGGDDKLIMIWQFIGRYPGSSSTSFGGKTVNIEQWRCVSTLRAHSGDILDLAWSPHDAWLASCSIDNTVVIWNAHKFPEVLSVLRGHTGLVKGITWDPVGKYVASQSDDRSLRVWRTIDWQQEASITKPFDECGGTTHVLRLSWSPDGNHIVSAHAMNNAGPTAQIIERNGWKANMDFVGHRKAITCVRFNPHIFSKVLKKGGNGKSQQYCCCAIGSRDRSLSIWLTALKRPLVITHDLFNNSVLDISWSKNGFDLLVCSWDGTVAFLSFTEDELGKPLASEEKAMLHKKLYGSSISINDPNHYGNTIIETPAMLKIQQQKLDKQTEQKAMQQNNVTTPKKNIPIMVGEGKPNPLAKQIETRTPDGRRRITPLCIAPQVDLGTVPEPFSITSPFGSPQQSTEQTCDASSNPPSKTLESVTALLPSITPISALDCRLTGKAKTNKIIHKDKEKDKVKEKTPDKEKEKEKLKETPKSREPKSSSTTLSSSISVKRKSDTTTVGIKRPRKDAVVKAAAVAGSSTIPTTPDRDSSRHAVYVTSSLQLPTPQPQKKLSLQILGRASTDPVMNIELENNINIAGMTIQRVKCVKGEQVTWEAVLTSRGLAMAGNSNFVCIACEDKSLYIISPNGRRLLPGIILSSTVSVLHCSGHFVMIISSAGNLHVWNVKKCQAVIRNENLGSVMPSKDVTISRTLLTDQGSPIITLSTGRTYTFNADLHCCSVAYGAAIYLLSEHNETCLVMAKSRVAPINSQLLTLPRLELMGTLIATRLSKYVSEALETKFCVTAHTLWSDNQAVLHWLHGNGKQDIFTKNRVSEILEFSQSLRYVNTADNPADLVTRGVQPETLSNSDFWWSGPSWLSNRDKWPGKIEFGKIIVNNDSESEVRKSKIENNISTPKVSEKCAQCPTTGTSDIVSDRPLLCTPPSQSRGHVNSENEISPHFHKSAEDFIKTAETVSGDIIDTNREPPELQNSKINDQIVSLHVASESDNLLGHHFELHNEPNIAPKEIIHATESNSEPSLEKDYRYSPFQRSTSSEIYDAEHAWLTSIQSTHFGDVVSSIRRQQFRHGVLQKQLKLFLDDKSILRIGGRLQNTDFPFETMHPILLPGKHRFTTLIILDAHHLLNHGGPLTTVNKIREKYWITAIRRHVNSTLRSCVVCKKVDGTPFPLPTQAPLPDFRVKEAVPFEFCGTDYTGHLFVRDQHTGLSSKVYVLIFTCASTRCIHLELTQDLTAASFILAMRRFTARRSTPRKMISDNGSTFIAAAKILKGLDSSPVLRSKQASRMHQMNPHLQQAATLSHLENQLAAALTVKSSKEYRFWLLTYARYLAQEGVENRLREICDDLLGPFYRGDVEDSKWDSNVLGMSKRDILQDILPIVGSNIRFQRVYMEYQEQLEMTRK
ncbi:protein HIRA [Saccoglossus kowalevskii]|uniref:Protein HIRA n=1 Tax=Saccoglossus kowalevskii TaxID=10224 RepID=A0ABM0GLI3_SACKO|nr:PREDICTED: protein HIRA [Saccoglossus kowalevskii]